MIWRPLVVAASVLMLILVSAGQTKNSRMQDEILKLESDFARAVIKNDAAAVGKIVADDWIIIDADGHVIDRARFLEVMRSGALTHEEMKASDERVRIYDDTAIFTALVSVKGKYAGVAFTSKERATDVFVKRNGRWQCVLTQTTRVDQK